MADLQSLSKGSCPEVIKMKHQTEKAKIKMLKTTLTAYKTKMKETKIAFVKFKQQKTAELDSVVRELLLLESRLRQEQKEIQSRLAYRDQTILSQKQEIEKLRRENRRLILRMKKSNENRQDSKNAESSSADDTSVKIESRVLHKPPIAEKPKHLRNIKKSEFNKSTFVTTIHKLLEEDSDRGFALSSGDSGSSSPESTLKPPTPRVIKLARQYENAAIPSLKEAKNPFFNDDPEVTSGYNSESVSEQEPDYENTLVGSPSETNHTTEDDYVIFTVVRPTEDSNQNAPEEDVHMYSNVEYQGGCLTSFNHDSNMKEDSSLDDSDKSSETTSTSTESLRAIKNVPRCRNNINQIIEYGNNEIMQNFEEFSLDFLDLDDFDHNHYSEKENRPQHKQKHSSKQSKKEGDLSKLSEAMSSLAILLPPGSGYDKFLEATGLSQKSILTPSRMFSNHRSMLKPRDIKHRNKLRTAFMGLSTLEESNDSTIRISSHSGEHYL